MGVAIIIKGCDFSAKNLGKVTQAENVALRSITIEGPSSVKGKASYSVSYNPTNVNESNKGVIWSIVSGSEFATIKQNGDLDVLASGSVVIKALSTNNPSISATKNITVDVVKKTYGLMGKYSTFDELVSACQYPKPAQYKVWGWKSTNNNGITTLTGIKIKSDAAGQTNFVVVDSSGNKRYDIKVQVNIGIHEYEVGPHDIQSGDMVLFYYKAGCVTLPYSVISGNPTKEMDYGAPSSLKESGVIFPYQIIGF